VVWFPLLLLVVADALGPCAFPPPDLPEEVVWSALPPCVCCWAVLPLVRLAVASDGRWFGAICPPHPKQNPARASPATNIRGFMAFMTNEMQLALQARSTGKYEAG